LLGGQIHCTTTVLRKELLEDIDQRESIMRDDVLLNKSAAIERCVARAKEEYNIDPASFTTHFSRQDATILNIQRACEAALAMGQHLIRREQLGVPQSARDIFELLAKSEWIERSLAEALKRMIGFRNIAIHE